MMTEHGLSRFFLIVVFVFPVFGSRQAISQTTPNRTGPLTELPSRPGPHIDRIKALAENAWLELGAPAADPKWGRARGRSWTAKMPLAPELRGAFLAGEGVHGYTKPDARYMDDLWFYDINAHRWSCCYPGADTKTLDLKINADGFEATPDGMPLPVASMVHGYEMMTYDTELKRFMSMPNPHGYEKRALPQRQRWWQKPPGDASPWLFETGTGRWNRLRTGTPAPPSSYGDTLIYLPARKQAFFAHRSNNVWLYDVPSNKWQKVAVKGPKPPFGIDATACYDSKRERIYMGGGSYPVAPAGSNAFWIYDLKTNTWIDPHPKGAPARGSTSYPTKNALMLYDSINDVVLLIVHSSFDSSADRVGIYVYDPTTNSWSTEGLPVPGKLAGNRKPKNGFYDPELNAVFIHTAGDSQDDGVIWVYRYRRLPTGALRRESGQAPHTAVARLEHGALDASGAEPTALAKLAAAMKPGDWAELKTTNMNMKLFSDGGHHALQYTDEAVWNPVARELIFSGQGHNGGNRFVKYSEATNRWTVLSIPPEYDADKRKGWGFVHAYDHQAVDPATGTYYRACYHRTDIRSYQSKDGTWSHVADIPDSYGIKSHITRGFEYFPEIQALVVYLAGNGLYSYSIPKKEWRVLGRKLGQYAYHELARYNPVYKLVVFGGGNDSKGFTSRKLWKLDSSGKITALQDAPFPIGITQTIFTVDPVSGKYLVFNRQGSFYEYDVASDSWRQLEGAKPPIVTFGSDLRASPIFGCVAAPISTHGVVMYVKYDGDRSKVYLYKHAAATP
jgi:hypothetical protein